MYRALLTFLVLGSASASAAEPLTPARAARAVHQPAPVIETTPGWPTMRVHCNAEVELDALGTPTGVRVAGCAPLFQEPTRTALLASRWWPEIVDGRPIPATQQVTLDLAIVRTADGRAPTVTPTWTVITPVR